MKVTKRLIWLWKNSMKKRMHQGPHWPAIRVQVGLADGLQRSPDDEAHQSKRQRDEEEKQVDGRRDQDTQGKERAGVLGALALLQWGGHAGGQEPVQEPVAGEHQAPWQAIQEVQTGTGVRSGVEDHLFLTFFLFLPLCRFLLTSRTLSTPACTFNKLTQTRSRDYIRKKRKK